MPQMSNLLWLPLMLFFTITMMIMIIKIFTYIKYINKNKLDKKMNLSKNWQW
uniref:ATP synthase F0 subunit 8 n=1 Tax=Criotettix japonicus TaxID=2793210 RepID=A0A7T0II23_9ORTH|nr:ATP synthase F0 subunit 8 [Criotettix japonicus]